MTINNGLADSLQQFYKVMKNTSNTKQSLPHFLKFIRNFIRTKDSKYSHPTIEIITIIKHEKPTIFYYLRQQGKNDPVLEMVTKVDMDYQKAKDRIEELTIELNVKR